MLKRARLATGVLALGAAALAAAGCGSSGGGGSGGGGKQGGTVSIVYGTAPDSLDPGFAYTTQAVEPDWISYTPLLTYRHAEGQAGTQLIPGLAKSLPKISNGGKTYTFQLRQGLKYSNGKAVKASDFAYTIERSIKIPWGGKSFFTNNIVGAADYDKGKAKSISGIKTNDKTGQITINLVKPYGPFLNVVAFPSTALVPSGTPMKNLPNNPPPGVGPYMITNVTPNQGFTLKKNPRFAKFGIPNIPTGHVQTINAKIQSNTNAEAQSVLNNQVDVFDPGDTLPPAIVPQVRSQASDRFKAVPTPSTFYFFLNVKTKPFSDPRARQAVNLALDKGAMQKLASGFLKPSCFFLPQGIVGHPTASCPYGTKPNLKKAQQLVKQAGLQGSKVTVWGEQREPRKQYVLYYASVLNKIGFKATPKIISDSTYFSTIGSAKTNPQTGFADWLQDFPHPADFYLLLSCSAIQPVNNENFSKVCDPKIESALKKLNPVPANRLQSVASQWSQLDQYVAKQAYNLVYGTEAVPKFTSNRINYNGLILHPVNFLDWTSLQLK